MPRIWKRMFGDCEHPHTLVVTSVGVRRTVCESCGHISFKMTKDDPPVPSRADKLPKAAGL
ncbi:MAG TPA: hypothetical protein VMQ46_09195 [Acidimicrobiia bacterium]|nr:hypothetical protein [Acidimicrobiia bacterium]